MIEKIFKTYVLKDPQTNLVRYVGATIYPLKRRLAKHLCAITNQEKIKWIGSLKLNGLTPIIKELKTHSTEHEMYSDEEVFIKSFRDIGHPILNNSTGGKTAKGYKHSDETKKNHSIFLHEYYKKHPEHLENLRRRATAPEAANNLRLKLNKPVVKFDLSGNKISRYDSAVIAANENSLLNSLISCCCRGKRNQHGGFVWKFEKDCK